MKFIILRIGRDVISISWVCFQIKNSKGRFAQRKFSLGYTFRSLEEQKINREGSMRRHLIIIKKKKYWRIFIVFFWLKKDSTFIWIRDKELRAVGNGKYHVKLFHKGTCQWNQESYWKRILNLHLQRLWHCYLWFSYLRNYEQKVLKRKKKNPLWHWGTLILSLEGKEDRGYIFTKMANAKAEWKFPRPCYSFINFWFTSIVMFQVTWMHVFFNQSLDSDWK